MPPALSDYDSDEASDGLSDEKGYEVVADVSYQTKEDCFREDDDEDSSEAESEIASVAPTATPIRTIEQKEDIEEEHRPHQDLTRDRTGKVSDAESSVLSATPDRTPPSAQRSVEDDDDGEEVRDIIEASKVIHTMQMHQEDSSSPMPQPSKFNGKKNTGMLAGLDYHNIIYISDDDNASTDYITPPTSSYHTTRQAVRGEQKVDLQYDAGYHPLDDYLRPMQAARVRSKYEADVKHEDVDSGSESDSDQDSLKLESGSESEEEDTVKSKGTKKLQGKGIKVERSPTRRSARATQQSRVVYNVNVHPQDKELRELGIVTGRKRRLDETSDDEEEEHSYQHKSKQVRISSKTVERRPIRSRPQKRKARAQSITSYDASNTAEYPAPHYYAEGLDVFDMPPGERYFPHKNDALFDGLLTPHGVFRIHEESHEVQQAAQASASPPRTFIDYEKENIDQEHVDTVVNLVSGVTIQPADVMTGIDRDVEDQLLRIAGVSTQDFENMEL
ncbi:uncharacterized protein BDZ99DRAFT_572130 [Mytilinidion resinicola]|uniref:Uncharacterized protein n=1 Tax=Mytilinidion resinicola TaxID=574789 RepID=A0A6A6YI38_9PEZI|nr:uncharacterized protein BDZ99DRAFT_572130 [Mytilinidion resinicola]KAF2808239.1 hypothetical protein BDZ99DRAFT_572130 [Mytilinidion resinicola]